ncbi:unnamed protein product, partial [Dibothriocephalus latus]
MKIFVGGIAFEHDEETIRNFFQTFGTVTDVNLLSNPGRQRHRGFAFVGFDDEEVVKKLIKMHYANLNGKQMEPGISGQTQRNPETGTLLVDQCPHKDPKINHGTLPYGVDPGLATEEFRTMDTQHLFQTPLVSLTVWVG